MVQQVCTNTNSTGQIRTFSKASIHTTKLQWTSRGKHGHVHTPLNSSWCNTTYVCNDNPIAPKLLQCCMGAVNTKPV